MCDLPEQVKTRLKDDCFRRADPEVADSVFRELRITPPAMLLSFYRSFKGPFGSKRTSFELLDVVGDGETIRTATQTCREEFSFPVEALVLTDLNANGVLVCDSRTGSIYNVDFEGGDIDFVEGRLSARWNSVEDFLRFYFE